MSLISRACRLSLIALVAAATAGAQQNVGRVEGVVTDAETQKPIADAGVQIVGTTLGTMTRADGRFSISNVPAGTVTIQVRRLGYQPRTLTGLTLSAGGVLTQNVALTQAVARVAAQIIRAQADRGSVESALEEQRNANQIVSSVTAEQIAKSPDANAAQAVQRVSGVTVQDGKYVFVRGLGERYTTTSLNGVRMPSPEPERKVVPFDLFPSGLLQSVTTSKTFTPDLPGDFSGAAVDIKTREYPIDRQVTIGTTLGYTEGTWSKKLFYAPGVGGEAFALAGSSRYMPAIARAAGDFSGVSQQSQKNAIINSFRDVWRPGLRGMRPNTALRASIGGNEPMFGKRVGYLVSGTYSNSIDLRDGQTRAIARPTSPTTQAEINRFTGTTTGESVLWGALVNAGTLLSANSRLNFNAVYNRTADNDARVERGAFEDLAIAAEVTRLDYVERSMWSTQLAGEHDMGRRGLDWSVAASGVSRNQPDRSELVYELVPGTGTTPERLLWVNTLSEGAVRTFADLNEQAGEAKVSHRWELGSTMRPWTLKGGALGRFAHRDANAQSFGIFAPIMGDNVRSLPPEELFGGRFTAPDSSVLNIRSLAQGGSYQADDILGAGYVLVDVPLSSSWKMITGARVEHSDVQIQALSTLGQSCPTDRTFTDVLPSLSLAYRPNEVHTLRLSGSRTLARPEYRELACVRSRDVLGGVDLSGNPALVRTLIDNADVRWEMYPRPGALVSAAVFAKRFHNPIERVSKSSSTNSFVGFENARSADNYGVELEGRQSLDVLADALAPFTAFSSVTIMRSTIDLGARAFASTNPSRAMVGQAPYVVNAGLTYTTPGRDGSATLLFNRVGERITEAGENPMPDVQELARNMLDLSLRLPARRDVTMRLDARNLLDARYRLRQGSVTREMYRIGRTIQVGVNVQR